MKSRRAVFLFGLAATIIAGIGLRLHTREQAMVGGRVRALDSDSTYHMRRARFAAAHFPKTILFDPLMNFPDGGVAIWPPLFDLALAAPARLVHGADASPGAVERGAAWVPLWLAAGAIALAGFLGRALYGTASGIVAAFFLAVCPGHILWSQYAHTDQHVAESFCGLLVLFLFLRSREHPSSAGNAAREAAAGFALAIAVLTWQGAIYWGAIFALSLLAESILARQPMLRTAVWTLGLPAILSGAATAAWLGWVRPPLTYVSFGFFQPLFLAALAGGTVAADMTARGVRGSLSRRELLGGLAVIAVVAAATLPVARELLAGLLNGIGYVAGTTREIAGSGGLISYPKDWLKGIFEARPLLADGLGPAVRQLSLAFLLAPFAVLLWAARARRGVRTGVYTTLAVWGAVTLFLALSQRLNVYYAAPFSALVLIEASRTAATRLRRRFRASHRPRLALLSAVVGIALALPMGIGIREELSAHYTPGSDLFDTLDRMRAELPHGIDPYDPRLLGPPPFPSELWRASSVLAPWSLGHLILYDAEQPVVANNFGYGFLDSIRFFLAGSEEEALAIARRHRARWVIATDLLPRMNDYASYLGKPLYLRQTPDGPVPSPAYFGTMQCRLYDFGGKGARLPAISVEPLRKIRLLFHSKSAVRRGDRWLPRWAIFEISAEETAPRARAPDADHTVARPPSPGGAPRESPPIMQPRAALLSADRAPSMRRRRRRARDVLRTEFRGGGAREWPEAPAPGERPPPRAAASGSRREGKKSEVRERPCRRAPEPRGRRRTIPEAGSAP
ncbi:MAG TPA: STT3 domain-containing protein, partial [Thermoanaerobaculia bacterium]